MIVHKQITIILLLCLHDRFSVIILFEKYVSENVMTCDSFQFSFLRINKAVWFETVEISLRDLLPLGFIFITPSPDCILSNYARY